MDCYTILEVDYGASDDEIKKSFRRLSLLHHPDRPGGNEKKYKEITRAYADIQKRPKQERITATHTFYYGSFYGQSFTEEVRRRQKASDDVMKAYVDMMTQNQENMTVDLLRKQEQATRDLQEMFRRMQGL